MPYWTQFKCHFRGGLHDQHLTDTGKKQKRKYTQLKTQTTKNTETATLIL